MTTSSLPAPRGRPPPAAPLAPPPTTTNAAKVAAVSAFARPVKTNRGWAMILNAVEGWGKTTCGASIPNAAIVMTPQEHGYETLFNAGRVPEIPCLKATGWAGLLEQLDLLIADRGDIGTVVFDALNGIERMCHEHVCEESFKGDWGEKGFSSFQRGYELSIPEWKKFLSKLETLNVLGVNTLILSHVKIETFKNPLGADYDRFSTDCHRKTWSLTHKYADACLFGTFRSKIITDSRGGEAATKKGKAVTGTSRIIYTERTDAYDAKNRFGMPEVIDIPDDYTQIWTTIEHAMKGV